MTAAADPITATVTPTAGPVAADRETVQLADARFIALATFRRSGEAVETPVLFVQDGDRLLVRTAHDAGKLKRIRNDGTVALAPCDQRGRHRGPVVRGRARILGPDAVEPALRLLHAKHRIAGPLFTTVRHLRGQGDVIIEIELDPAA